MLICEQLGSAVIAVAKLCGCLGPRGLRLDKSMHSAAVLAALHTEVAVWPLLMQRPVSLLPL